MAATRVLAKSFPNPQNDIIRIVKSSDTIYLDYAAATPVADFVYDAMKPYVLEYFYNPSSPYFPAVKVRREYDAAKGRLAQTIGAKGDELIATAGATESINLAFSLVNGHVVTTAIEHAAVLETAKAHEHTLVAVDQTGRVDVEAIRAAIRDDTELISVSLANSELGTLQPLRKIAAMLTSERAKRLEAGNARPLLFHSDASQGFGLVDIHVARLGVDLLTLNAAKVYGPKQVGVLWAKSSVRLKPVVRGGGQERGLRSGTENVSGVVGFAAAAEWAARHQSREAKRLMGLRDQLQDTLLEHPRAVLLGSEKYRLPNFLSISFPGIDAERLIFMLEAHGVLVATGSACSANKHTASHVLVGIGLDEMTVGGSLRLTLGRDTTAEKIDRAARMILKSVDQEYTRMATHG